MKQYVFIVLIFFPIYSTLYSQSFLSHTYSIQENSSLSSSSQKSAKFSIELLQLENLFFDSISLQLIQELMDSGELNLAESLLNNLKFPKQSILSLEDNFEKYEYLKIKVLFLLNKKEEAEDQARKYLNNKLYQKYVSDIFYYFMKSLYDLNKPLELTELIRTEIFQDLSPKKESFLRFILSKHALEQNNSILAFHLFFKDQDIPQSSLPFAKKIIQGIKNFSDYEILKNNITNPILQQELRLKKIELHIKDKNYLIAEEEINYFMDEIDDSSFLFSELENMENILFLSKQTNPLHIGVILPFTHPNKNSLIPFLAREVQEGLQIAFNELSTEEYPIKLIFKNSNFNPETAEEKIEELILEDNVIAIVGPLSLKSSISAGNIASEYKTPLISYSRTQNIGKDIPYLFRYYRSLEQEAKTLANYSIDYLNIKRFVLFYSSGTANFKRLKAFWNSIEKGGAKIVGIEKISKNQPDFQSAFRRVTGIYQFLSDHEKTFFKQVLEKENEMDIDFNGIYVPFTSEKIKDIYSFSKVYNTQNMWFLAGNEINNNQSLMLKFIPKLRFADTFWSGIENQKLQDFFEIHWKTYDYKTPYYKPTAYTLYGYESLKLLVELLQDSKNHSRIGLKDTLSELKRFPVLSGEVTAEKNGELVKNIYILKVNQGKIQKWP